MHDYSYYNDCYRAIFSLLLLAFHVTDTHTQTEATHSLLHRICYSNFYFCSFPDVEIPWKWCYSNFHISLSLHLFIYFSVILCFSNEGEWNELKRDLAIDKMKTSLWVGTYIIIIILNLDKSNWFCLYRVQTIFLEQTEDVDEAWIRIGCDKYVSLCSQQQRTFHRAG